MPKILNYAECNYEFPYHLGPDGTGAIKTLVFPRVRNERIKTEDPSTGKLVETDEAEEVPGEKVITDEELKRMQADPVTKSWFSRKGLQVSGEEPKSKKAA